MGGTQFDTLLRRLASARSRREALSGLVGGAIGLIAMGESEAKRRRHRKKKHKGQTPSPPPAPTCDPANGCECCRDNDTCFALSIDPQDSSNPNGPKTCCTPDVGTLCRTRSTLPDQCCYPDETCDPSLIERFGIAVETNCCRPCPGEPSGCCIKQNDECNHVTGLCQNANTARLPRTRRPA